MAVAAGALLLTACGGGDTGAGGDGTETGAEGETEAATGEVTCPDDQTVDIGWIPWDEDIALTNLWHVILEDNGYTVEQTQLDAGPLFDGVASGDLDLFLDAWLPNTHEDYWQQYSDQVADLGVWLSEAPLTWVVPSYVDEVDSIADLEGNADMFDGQVIGIEASAGLTRISREEVIPTYDLGDEYELVEGSTTAMLAELERAISNEQPIVVTLWQPHFAYGQWDLKNLEDPENGLGDPDEIHSIACQGIDQVYPDVATAVGNMKLDNDTIAALEVAINEAGDGNEMEGARTWLEENRDVVEPWLEGTDLSL